MREKCGYVFAMLSVGLPTKRDGYKHKIINNGTFILLTISVYIFQKNITRLPFAIHCPQGEDRRGLQVLSHPISCHLSTCPFNKAMKKKLKCEFISILICYKNQVINSYRIV